MIPQENLDNNLDDSSFDADFSKALRRFGYLFPESEDELEYFKSIIASDTFEIPKELCDPLKIISKSKITGVSNVLPIANEAVVENLAMAAREGKEIPKEILDQMKSDRKKSEDNDA